MARQKVNPTTGRNVAHGGLAGPGPCARCGCSIAVQAGGMMCGPCAAWVPPPPNCVLCGAAISPSAPLGMGGFCPACYLQATGQSAAGPQRQVQALGALGGGWHQAAVGRGVAMTGSGVGGIPLCAACGAPAIAMSGLRPTCANCAVAAAHAEPLPRDDLRLVDLIGWRIWRVTGPGYLRSLTAEVIWLPGEPMEAAKVTDHGAASNGIHVFADKAAALKEMTTYLDLRPVPPGYGYSYALGSVLLWGDVVEHERGYRAERAKILSIDDVVWEGKPPWDAETKRALAFLRERYGVAG